MCQKKKMSYTLIATPPNFTSLSPSTHILDNCMGVCIIGRVWEEGGGQYGFSCLDGGWHCISKTLYAKNFGGPMYPYRRNLGLQCTRYTTTLVGIIPSNMIFKILT